MVWEYFVKSRNVKDYREMLMDSLYHPPRIAIDMKRTGDERLALVHRFEGKPLLAEYIANTMLGIEYLWGGTVELETREVVAVKQPTGTPVLPGLRAPSVDAPKPEEIKWRWVRYTMKERKLSKTIISKPTETS
jgi:stage V sporulation protein R